MFVLAGKYIWGLPLYILCCLECTLVAARESRGRICQHADALHGGVLL